MITIDLRDKRPIYLQVIEGIEDLAIKGVLKPQEQLPSVRNLAMELSLNPNTIQRAYLELEKKGTTYSIQGKGSFISDNQIMLTSEKKETLHKDLKLLVASAKMLGVEETEFVEWVDGYYHGKGDVIKND
ncbi:MAG: GntR family transcriptional regulator [Clostridiales bacterium]